MTYTRLAAATLLAGATALPVLAQSVTLTLAHQYPDAHASAGPFNAWADRVEELSEGDIAVNSFGGSTLIGSDEAFPAVASGSVDASQMIGGFQTGDIPSLAVLGMPFMFDDYEHYRRVVDAGLYEMIAALYEEQGIKLLNLFPKGSVQVFHKDKFLLEPSDFEGAQLRGVGGAASEALDALGANEVRLPTTEVTAALQRGVVNGLITNCVAHIGRSWYEEAPYVSLVAFANDGEGIGMNLDTWESFSADQQEVVAQASAEMQEQMWDLMERVDESECLEQWSELGVQVKEATPEQRAALREAMAPVYEQYSADLPIVAEVQALIDEQR